MIRTRLHGYDVGRLLTDRLSEDQLRVLVEVWSSLAPSPDDLPDSD